MNKTNLDQALAALADALKSSEPDSYVNSPKEFVKKIPLRSLSGDHIEGGKILKFSSAGITDQAASQQILIKDDGVHITTLSVENLESWNVNGTISAKTIKADILDVKEIKAEIKFEKDEPIIFSGPNLDGKGLLWATKTGTKQLVLLSNPDRFFVSENIDFAKGKGFSVNNIKLLDETTLGPTVVKSNLREVGKLNGLIVDGSVSIGQYLYFSNETNRLGLGIEEPNSAFSIAEDGIEIVLGTKDFNKGYIGTFASNEFNIVTDSTSRISVSPGGNILLGNTKAPPIQVSVHGKLSVRVSTPDPEVDLHVNGSIKFNNRLQKYDKTYPTSGSYNDGDIVWNIEPRMNSYVGWVCIQTGSPGIWAPFGKIGNS
jgi:hypothetical protein